MDTKALRIAVVGAGLIGKKHIEIVLSTAILHAIVDPSATAKALASELSVPWFPDIETCLDESVPDGAIIASPNHLHASHASACLRQSIPVLVEKPLADCSQAGRRILAQAISANTPVLVGHHRRHSPITKAAKAVVEQGRLGRLVSATAQFWLNKPDDYFEMEWRTRPGGGPIYINLIHDIDLLQHLCGEIVAVQASETNRTRGHAVEDTSAIIATFASGALGAISVSDTISAPWSWELTSGENMAYPQTDQSCYTIGGTEGALSLPDLRVWSHKGSQSWWSPIESQAIPVKLIDPVAAQFEHFCEVIHGAAAPLVSAEDGLRNIEVLESIKRAAASGTIERVRSHS